MVKYGVKFLMLIPMLISDNSNIKGIKINNPPAGAGTPSKIIVFPILNIINLCKIKSCQSKHTAYRIY